ncbi:MAG: M48 family metallopeptidase, partial [Candidatus Izemoplasmatales bacterium]|nr:M48 family metallopeptidase [Candidatus Izemoplasmatales bacterium]
PWVASWMESITSSLIWQNLFFVGMYYLVTSIPDFLMDYYKQFIIEERHGFNRNKPALFWVDKLKSTALLFLLGGAAIAAVIAGLGSQLDTWSLILVVWAVAIVVQLLVNILFTKVFIRLFNKLTPLDEGPLKSKIIDFSQKAGYQISKISVMDASKRTTKLNAFFSGFGRFKQVVLFDNLIHVMKEDEVVAVLAHEIGHGLHKDVFKNMVRGFFLLFAYIALFILLVKEDIFSVAFLFPGAHFGFGIILFSILISPIDSIIQIPLSYLSRKMEYAADGYAASVGLGNEMIQALKGLSRVNLSNLTPHPLVVKLTYSHPPMSSRIESILKLLPKEVILNEPSST